MLRIRRLTLIAEDTGTTPREVTLEPEVLARLVLREPRREPLPGGGQRYVFDLSPEELAALGDTTPEERQAEILGVIGDLRAVSARLSAAGAEGPSRFVQLAVQAALAEAMAAKLGA